MSSSRQKTLSPKSPFLVNQFVLPNKLCEEFVRASMPNTGDMFSEPVNNIDVSGILDNIIIPNINTHYKTNIAKSDITIESHSENSVPVHACESSVFSAGKWYRNKDIDFVTIIFLKNHLSNTDDPIDTSFEIFGGNLEFPTFDFKFKAERGTAVTYPAVPNFINTISQVKIGQLNLLRIVHRSDTMFVYEPFKYTGTPATWFANLI